MNSKDLRPKIKKVLINEVLRYIVALLGVLIIGAVLIYFQGGSPMESAIAIIDGAFGGWTKLGNTIRWISPCILTGIAATVAFKTGIWNMGIGGQLYCGAFAATMIALYADLPPIIFPFVCILVGGIFGMLFAAIPAFLRWLLDINEMISTLLLNYVASLLTEYLTKVVKGISAGNNSKAMATPLIKDAAKLGKLVPKTNANTGIFIAIFILFAVIFLFKYTVLGYEMRQVGANINFARVGGVKTTRIYIFIFLLSGFISGICGAIEVLGVYSKFTPNFASNIGWDGIMIANIAGCNPLLTGIVAILWGALKSGALHMERITATNRLTIELMQSIFVMFVTINYFSVYANISKHRKAMPKEVDYA